MSKRNAPVEQAPMSLFPIRAQAETAKGPKRLLGFRCPEPPLSYIQGILKRGYTLTDVVTQHVILARDVLLKLDSLWMVVELESKQRGCSPGEAVAEMALEVIRQKYPALANFDAKSDPKKK